MSYKSAAFRSQQHPGSQLGESKRHVLLLLTLTLQAHPCPTDLLSLLLEVAGDVQLAAQRISEGRAEQWGSDHPVPRDRTDSRGSRGARGGRAGARGARGRGSARGGSGANGHASRPSHPGKTSSPAPDIADKQPVDDLPDSPQPDKPDLSDGITSAPHEPPTDSSPSAELPLADPSLPTHSFATPSSWDVGPWGAQDQPVSAPPALTPPISAAPRPIKLPATSKLSWAQIARPQEKPPVALPPAAAPRVPPASVPESSEFVPALSVTQTLQVTPPPEDAWSSSVHTQSDVQDEIPAVSPQEDSVPEIPASVPSEPSPVPQQLAEELVTAPTPSKSPVSIPARSSAASHRSASRFKATDQAVVMPTSGFNPGLEKVGMQFGSLSLGGDDRTRVNRGTSFQQSNRLGNLFNHCLRHKHQLMSVPRLRPPVQPTSIPSQIAPQPQTAPSASIPVPAPAPAPAPVPPSVPQSQQSQPSLTSAISHPSISTSVSHPVVSSSPAFSQQAPASIHPSLSQHQQQAPLTQHQVPTHQYTHHGLPTHLDAAQNPVQQSQHTAQPSQAQASAAHSAYFRQAEAPYFHTPTPPAGQAQDYNIFGQIGQQHQASHLGGFANNDYGYGDNQRGFYDSYAQSPAFGGSRNVLGHDDVKGLPTSQQLPGSTILPASNAQSSQLPPRVVHNRNHLVDRYYGTPYNSGYGVPQQFVKYPTMFQPGPPAQAAAPSPGGKQGPGSVQSQSDHYGRGLYGQQHQLPTSTYDDLGKHPQLYGGQAIQSFMGLGQGNAAGSGPSLAQRTGGTSPENTYKSYSQNVGVKDGATGVGVGQGVGQPQSGRGVQQAHTQGGFYGANRFGKPRKPLKAMSGIPQGNSDANFYQYQARQQGYWQ
ncbi:hypothetical protein JVU11DRAFT_8908 [Chiua virens]|nr:hypothetical protein JVU11DRAFT_8908 [Chiua virens]